MNIISPFQTKVAWFFEELKNKKLVGTRCKKCKVVYCPPRADCSKCYSSDMEHFELSGKGAVLAYTIIYVAPESFSCLAPYILVIAKLDEGPKLLSHLVGVKPEDVKIGMRVEAVFEPTSNGLVYYNFKPMK
jgi:uncharacterized OB-fold protein